jgi:hypothetical protein
MFSGRILGYGVFMMGPCINNRQSVIRYSVIEFIIIIQLNYNQFILCVLPMESVQNLYKVDS